MNSQVQNPSPVENDLLVSMSHNSIMSENGSRSHVSSSTNDSHHSLATLPGTLPMLPVYHEAQLEVILPISSTPLSSQSHDSHTINFIHPMVTRLKGGAITQKSYKGYIASLPELQSLQSTEE